jgi:hypothetical protein
MARRLVAAAVFGLLTAVGAAASAQEPVVETAGSGFGEAHPFVLSLEHLGGVSYQRIKFEGEDAQTATQVGLFTSFFSPVTPVARLGLHYFVAPNVSVGALLGYVDNDLFGTTWLIGARVGYAAPMSPTTALWIRGGILYTETKFSAFGTLKFRDVLPGGELLLVAKVADNFGIMIGPMFEIGVAGKESVEAPAIPGFTTTTPDRKYSYFEAALTFGVLADF